MNENIKIYNKMSYAINQMITAPSKEYSENLQLKFKQQILDTYNTLEKQENLFNNKYIKKIEKEIPIVDISYYTDNIFLQHIKNKNYCVDEATLVYLFGSEELKNDINFQKKVILNNPFDIEYFQDNIVEEKIIFLALNTIIMKAKSLEVSVIFLDFIKPEIRNNPKVGINYFNNLKKIIDDENFAETIYKNIFKKQKCEKRYGECHLNREMIDSWLSNDEFKLNLCKLDSKFIDYFMEDRISTYLSKKVQNRKNNF